jgi:uncharacterized protein YjbI with pentapeptide repeats
MKNYTAEQLAEIIKKHGMWLRDEDGGEPANLSYANLSYANLSYADLSYANLSYANLSSADLSYANLSYANLSSADLSYANLSYADLSYANLSYANLSSANLSYADLSYANLSYANLSYADLSYANLSYANLSYAAGNSEHIKSIFVSEVYPIVYTVDYLWIGCERHLISDWASFDDRRILKMDWKRALEFWKQFKDFIFMSIQIAPAAATGFIEKVE